MSTTQNPETSTGKIFSQAYNSLEKIDFDESWVTDDGYYDNIHGRLNLEIGEMKASYDDVEKKRLIFIGTRLGIICVYDRYSNQEHDGIYHVNVPECKNGLLNLLIPTSVIGKRDMVSLLGSWNRLDNNIGIKIENVYKEMLEKMSKGNI